MRETRHAAGLLLVGFLSLSGIALSQEREVKGCAGQLDGAWKEVDGDSQLLFQGEQVLIHKSGSLRFARILDRGPCQLVVRDQGLLRTWKLELKDGVLRIDGAGILILRPLSSIPAELDTSAPILPDTSPPVSAEKAKETADELLRRARIDQSALKDPALKGTRSQIIAENVKFLRDLTRVVGWIDIPRFGKDAAAAATLIAKHGSDLLLMRAALPSLERDVKEHGGSGEMFSVLYDELAIVTGNKQRYGTQIDEDSSGRPFVLPVEDPSQVDALRREIGILPWQQYLALVSKNLYGGATIRIAGGDE